MGLSDLQNSLAAGLAESLSHLSMEEAHGERQGARQLDTSRGQKISSSEANKLREFRKLVTSRNEPSTVIFLRRLVLIMTALMLGILSVETALKFNFYKGYDSMQRLRLSLEEITIDLMHVESGFRSLINVHNGFY